MKLKVYRSTWGLVDDSDGKKAKVRKKKSIMITTVNIKPNLLIYTQYIIFPNLFQSPFHTYDEALPELKRLGYDGVEVSNTISDMGYYKIGVLLFKLYDSKQVFDSLLLFYV